MFGSLFNSENIIEKGTDALISAGDKLFYTDEEKADMNLKLREFHLKVLAGSEQFKVAQRLLAVWFSGLFGSAFIVGLMASIFNMISTYKQTLANVGRDIPLPIVEISLQPLFNLIISFNMGVIMALIIAWYFSGGVIDSFKRKM